MLVSLESTETVSLIVLEVEVTFDVSTNSSCISQVMQTHNICSRLDSTASSRQRNDSKLFYKIVCSKIKGAKSKATSNKSKTANNDANVIVEYDRVNVVHYKHETLNSVELVYTESVQDSRPYILCAILRQVDLKTPGNLKKFLNIQVSDKLMCSFIFEKKNVSIFID